MLARNVELRPSESPRSGLNNSINYLSIRLIHIIQKITIFSSTGHTEDATIS